MKGAISHELEIGVPAGELWGVYSTLQLAKLVVELLPNVVERVDVIQGDGGAGTILDVTFPPGAPGPKNFREKFVKIDNDKRVKDAEVIEGGYLDLGFCFYRNRFEVIERGNASSIIKSTIEYEIEEESAANVSLVTTSPLAAIAETIGKHLMEKKASVLNS